MHTPSFPSCFGDSERQVVRRIPIKSVLIFFQLNFCLTKKDFLKKDLIFNISHKLLKPTQFLEKFSEIPGMFHLIEINQAPAPLLNVAVYWQSSNTEACTIKFSQILANNIDKGGKGIGPRIYVRYCICII